MTGEGFIRAITGATSDNSIVINNQAITSSVDVESSTVVTANLTVKDCVFQDHFDFKNWIFENDVQFDGCFFEKGIRIDGGVFKQNLDIMSCEAENDFRLTGGSFDKIHLSFRNTQNIYITGGKFKELNFGYRVGDNNFNELRISSSHSETEGNFKIAGLTFNKIVLIGANFKEVLFQNIKCNHFCIENFYSSSPLKIYGLEPQNNNQSFFEVNKSNISKAQIVRVDFEKFTEVIFVDSYFNDVNLILANWGERNYRGIASTQYGTVVEQFVVYKRENNCVKISDN